MTADKGKKAKVEEEGEPIDGELVIAIEKLQDVQEELEKINDEANDKLIEVEQKYNVIRRPSYNKRNEIIQSIPDFWLNAFLCHPALTDLLTEDDQKVFKYLKSLDVEDSKDVKSGYTITFIFSPNPYFENDKLVKSYAFVDDGSCQITGTAINWKKGMDISGVADREKKGKKRSANEESFFSWFSDSSEQGLDGVPDEVAEIIKDELWPNPLRYLNNEAEEAEEDDDEEGTDEDNEDDDEEKEE